MARVGRPVVDSSASGAGSGVPLGGGRAGKRIYRVRESHLRDHLAPLISAGKYPAVKLDLVLRDIALSPQHSKRRARPGVVIRDFTYEHLHDLARGPGRLEPGRTLDDESDDAKTLRVKRNWTGRQLAILGETLVERTETGKGNRPALHVLSDLGDGSDFDDPDGKPGNEYVTLLGGVIASGDLAAWTGPELAAYLAAMSAESLHRWRLRKAGLPEPDPGAGEWFQPLSWFSNPVNRASGPAFPVSPRTLSRGLRTFLETGVIVRETIRKNPITGKRFRSPRALYTNNFAALAGSAVVDLDVAMTELLETTRA